MDGDPELDVTLSNGRRVVTFQVTPLDHDLGTWTVVEPPGPRHVILGDAEALQARRQMDARIAARLAAGWVPVERGTGTLGVRLSEDVALPLGSLLETVTRARETLRAADPTGQLWAACVTFLQQAQRFGVAAPATRRERAQRERRLGVVAEAMLDYRSALATHRGVGVRRRLTHLETFHSTVAKRARRVAGRVGPLSAASVTGTVQLACPIDRALHAQVRRQATRTGQTVRTWVIGVLVRAVTR